MSLQTARWASHGGAALSIVGTSAWNALGFTPHQIWAARRAELTALSETPFVGRNGKRLTMACVRTLSPTAHGVDRLVPLARRALEPLLAQLSKLPPALRIGLTLCLGEHYPTDSSDRLALEQAISEQVRRQTGRKITVRSLALGHAGLAYALLEAGQAISSQTIDAALLGGVETSYDPDTVDALVEQGRIFDGENLDSFIPGEGAAFILIARADVARTAGWPSLARLEAAATHPEPAPLLSVLPSAATGLSRALRAIADHAAREKRNLDYWLADVTGEVYRSNEWQLAMPRASDGVSNDSSTLEFLPVLLGDLGAATLGTAVAIGVEAMRRGAPAATTCVACASSLGEARGAVWISRG